MPQAKFKATKFTGIPTGGSLTNNHVYYSKDIGPNWNSQWHTEYVSTTGSALSKSAILANWIHEEAGIYFEEPATWPPAIADSSPGAIVANVGEDGSPYIGAAGFGRTVALGNTFLAQFDPSINSFVLNVNASAVGADPHTLSLTRPTPGPTAGGTPDVLQLKDSSGGTGSSAVVNPNDVIEFQFKNVTDKNVLMAGTDPTVTYQPNFRRLTAGLPNVTTTAEERGDIWAEALPVEAPAAMFAALIHKGKNADWTKQALYALDHFQLDQYSSSPAADQISLADGSPHTTFLPDRGAVSSSRLISRAVEAGTPDITPGGLNYIGDVNFETSDETTTGRLIVRWGSTGGFGKQTTLDPTYFVKGASNQEDMLTLDPGALGQSYTAGVGKNLEGTAFGYAITPGPGQPNISTAGTKYNGITYQANHVEVAYNNTQFLINANNEIELRPSVLAGSDWKESVNAATTANLGGYNGTGGTASNGEFTGVTNSIDGVTLQDGDRVLVKDQTNQEENGIYVVITAGTGANGNWERAIDHDSDPEVSEGNTVSVGEGTTHKDEIWRLVSNDPLSPGTSPQQWERIAIFAITDGNGLWVDPSQSNLISFQQPTGASAPGTEVQVGQTFKGITYDSNILSVDADTNYFEFNSAQDNEFLTFSNFDALTVFSNPTSIAAKPTTLAPVNPGVDTGQVFKLNDAGDALEFGYLKNINIDANAGIELSKLQDVTAFTMLLNNTTLSAPPDEQLQFSQQSVVIRKAGITSGSVLSQVITEGNNTTTIGGFLGRAFNNDLGSYAFDKENFIFSGTTLQVAWADVQW